MSLSIVLRSDLGIPGAGSLELKIAYALWETERAKTSPPLPTTSVLTLSSVLVRHPQSKRLK